MKRDGEALGKTGKNKTEKFHKKYTKSCYSLNLYFSGTLFKMLHENNYCNFFFALENFIKQGYPVSNPENTVQIALLTFFSPKENVFSFRKHFSISW